MRFPTFAIDRRQRWRDRLPHAAEIALVSLLAAQAARLVWMLAVPPATVGDADTAPSASATQTTLRLSGDPFFRTASSPQARDAALGYRLFAVRGGPDGGSAILAGKDGLQAAYRVGDAVADGIVLHAVGADHATLRAGGGDHRLSLQADPAAATGKPAAGRASALPSARPAATNGAATAGIDAGKLLAGAGLRPRTENGRVTGYSLIGRGDTALLREAGLEPGDVLLTVNGQQLNAERMSELEQELASRDQVQLTVQRGADTRTITLRTKLP